MPIAEFRGAPLFYTEHVDGPAGRPPLVLVHGAGGTHLHWPPQMRRLPGVAVYALDLPGHGASGGEAAAAATVAEKAEALIAVLDHLGCERAVVCGHSMGGAIAQTVALDYPARTAGLVLAATGAKLRVAPEILGRIETDFSGAVDTVIQWAFGPSASEQLTRLARARMLEVNSQVLLGDWRACDGFDARERLGEIAAPTLVLGGTEDPLTPEKYARYLADRIPGAELRLLPGCGHMLMLEQPETAARLVAEFMAKLR